MFGSMNDIVFGFETGKDRLGKLVKCTLFFLWAATHYDIFHFFYGQSLMPRTFIDLPILRMLGKKIFVHFRGMDVRNYAICEYKHALMRGEKLAEKPPVSTPEQQARVRMWRRYANAMFISEPDLFACVPDAILVPQAIDLNEWEYSPMISRQRPIKVMHAPSWRRKKGTDYIIAAIQYLKEKGYDIELVLAENVPHEKMKLLYQQAHIVVDQLLVGWYGNVSIEAMATGRPVICYIDDELRKKYRPDLPIISADPWSLTDKLVELIADPEQRLELGQRGREYVEKWHSVEKIVAQLLDIYNSY
jgi:glycosyltransferase involved in cell wall biosynthesis